jgi:hypothetical protein
MSAILAPLSLCPSARRPTRHIRFVANTTQTLFRPGGDRAVKAHIPLFSGVTFAICQPQSRIGFANVRQRVAKIIHPPPGGRRFVANKRQTAIQQPYDSLVEAIFSAAFDFGFANC